MNNRYLPLLILAFLNPIVHAQVIPKDVNLSQIWEAGLPFITHYSAEDYRAHVQNWCFVQDTNGIMYMGNTSGVLQFDGSEWRLLKLPNGSPAKSLAKTDDGTIYVGAVRDLGYLQPDASGRIQFQSLLSKLDTVYRDFADIWFTYAYGQTIYFISDRYIFRWSGNMFTVWKAEQGFGFAGLVHDKLYVDNMGKGIMTLQNDSLTLIPDGERFLKMEHSLTTFLPYGKDKMLVGHYQEGLFLYDHHKFIPFGKQGKAALQEKNIYCGQVLQDGNFLFATQGNGCFSVDRDGNVVQWLGKKNGLLSDEIIGCYVDQQGSLWLATENGIDRIEISSPLRFFGEQNGLTEGIQKLIYYNNKVYAAAKNGLFYLEDHSPDPEKKIFLFKKVRGIDFMDWDLITKGNYLIAATFAGTYAIDRNHKVQQLLPDNTWSLCSSLNKPNRVYAGTTRGKIFILKLMTGGWQVEDSSLSLEGRILRMEENPDGSLWISTRYNGFYRLKWEDSNSTKTFDKPYRLEHFTTEHGLPEISYNTAFRIHGRMYFSTQQGVYSFDSVLHTFYPDTSSMKFLQTAEAGIGILMKEASQGGMWIAGGPEYNNWVFRVNDSKVSELTAAGRISKLSIIDMYELNNLLFFSGVNGIVCYNQQQKGNFKSLYPVNLREVVTNNDSLIYGGNPAKIPSKRVTFLPYSENSIQFVYSLPDYIKPESNQYQYLLEGYDKGWSSWSTETGRYFTNLHEGDYRFRIRAKNVYGQISDEATYAFSILPPWYRSLWMYVFSLIAGVAIIALIVRWRSNQLIREKNVMEQIITDRTRQLARQAEQLKEMDTMKSRLFANISHEFRTPLTLIKGPVAELLGKGKKSLSQSDAEMIDRNTDRLLRLVNQLLDLSRLDAGSLETELEAGDINHYLRALAAAFSSHAVQRGIEYRINIPSSSLYVLFDHDKLEKIIYNLLSNAFKYTADNGLVTISATWQNNQLEVVVADNGTGIAEEDLPRIFDRFYQSDNSATREQEGTGIGLSLTRELVTLMEGSIQIKSKTGKGSSFKVILPATRAEGEYEETTTSHLVKVPRHKNHGKNVSTPGPSPTAESPIVLIIEDNEDMRSFLKAQLETDHVILESVNGEEGLVTAVKNIPDLIITDLMMPRMNGLELCRRLKTDERTSHIPVIMLTAKAGLEQKIEGLETGADDYLTKPFNRDELLIRVKNLIVQRETLRRKFGQQLFLQPRNISISSADEKFISKVNAVLEEKFSDERFGVPEFQHELAMSKTQLHRKIKAVTDHAPGEFIRQYRLQQAAKLLTHKSGNVTEIAFAVGFSSLSYFTRSFRALYQKSPSEYAAQQSNISDINNDAD